MTKIKLPFVLSFVNYFMLVAASACEDLPNFVSKCVDSEQFAISVASCSTDSKPLHFYDDCSELEKTSECLKTAARETCSSDAHDWITDVTYNNEDSCPLFSEVFESSGQGSGNNDLEKESVEGSAVDFAPGSSDDVILSDCDRKNLRLLLDRIATSGFETTESSATEGLVVFWDESFEEQIPDEKENEAEKKENTELLKHRVFNQGLPRISEAPPMTMTCSPLTMLALACSCLVLVASVVRCRRGNKRSYEAADSLHNRKSQSDNPPPYSRTATDKWELMC